MSSDQTPSSEFSRTTGLKSGSGLIRNSAFARFINKESILKLNSAQQEFISRYGEWMDEFINTVEVQKADPDNKELQEKVLHISEKAEKLKPELDEHMKDPAFSMIYKDALMRIGNKIY